MKIYGLWLLIDPFLNHPTTSVVQARHKHKGVRIKSVDLFIKPADLQSRDNSIDYRILAVDSFITLLNLLLLVCF